MTIALKYELITENKIIAILNEYDSHQDQGKTFTLDKYLISKNIFSDECMKLLTSATDNIKLKKRGKMFGNIAIKMNFVTKQDIYDALILQASESQKNNSKRFLGQILIEQNKITEKQCDLVLSAIKHNIDQKAAKKEEIHKPDTTEPDTEPTAAPDITLPDEPKPSKPFDPKSLYGSVPDSPTSHRDTTGIKLGLNYTITHDGMGAFLTYNSPVGKDTDKKDEPEYKIPDLEEILDMLVNIGAVNGIADNTLIQDYLDNHLKSGETFRIASGQAPVPGKSAEIIHHFVSSHLKSGSMSSQGNIDFRDRGKIPVVEEGSLLTERIPGYPCEHGKDVYGNIIYADPVTDEKLKCGTGVTLSEDGLRVTASEKGQPKLSLTGKISVLTELKIPGNVDYKTGHIDFEGNITVKGVIRNGFRVNGDHVKAENIVGAQVTATGDITISGGIIDSTIRATGNVFAKFIHKSSISAYGDVTIEKEIIDTSIENSGQCIIERGKIISSDISSKKGIRAKDIGTEISTPCKFIIGAETHRDNEIVTLQNKIDVYKEKLTELTEAKDKLKNEDDEISLKINKLAHVQDRSQLEIKSMQEKLAEAEKKQAPEEVINIINEQILNLSETSKEADDSINNSFERQDQVADETVSTDNEISGIDDQIQETELEVNAITDWAEKEEPNPVLEAAGLIYDGAVIHGNHSVLILKEKSRGVKIKELRSSEPPYEWKIHVF